MTWPDIGSNFIILGDTKLKNWFSYPGRVNRVRISNFNFFMFNQ
jgi:hypothetical protein